MRRIDIPRPPSTVALTLQVAFSGIPLKSLERLLSSLGEVSTRSSFVQKFIGKFLSGDFGRRGIVESLAGWRTGFQRRDGERRGISYHSLVEVWKGMSAQRAVSI